MSEKANIASLLSIMARLRHPVHGCPWDAKQNFDSIAPYTIEEAYEVADAIQRRDFDDLRDELGDLLFQVVFHARMAEEAGHFGFDDVVMGLADKLTRRHPHVFKKGAESFSLPSTQEGEEIDAGNAAPTPFYASAEEQSRAWEELKAQERAKRGDAGDQSALAGIAAGLPEWRRALKLQQRAATVGFDWPGPEPVLDKLAEEIAEVRAEFDQGADCDRLEDEIGDVLFVIANLARHAKIDPGHALRRANAKFERRFRRMESLAAEAGETLAGKSLAEQDELWDRAKAEES
ncbi:MAG TPA: nucleoside triphosphate pyrophosphohydrolase [Rhodanobacteraceae bacterium]|nr:nucleoside triphosphate pyrophosphohydrolase [Rhodanobacteraceae bacterium]